MNQYTMRKPAGYIIQKKLGTDTVVLEGEMAKCVHCEYMWIIRPGSGIPRGFCMQCNGLTCGKTECMRCAPADAKFEAMFNRMVFQRQMSKVFGW